MKSHNNNFAINGKFFLLLLAIDLGFILLHFYNSVLIPDSEFRSIFSLVDDTSISEKFQYFKWALIAALFVYMSIKRNIINYIPWGLIFIYLLLDDSLTLHERIGAVFAQGFTGVAPLSLRWQDVGELMVTAIAGGVLFSLLALAYYKGNRVFKKVTKDMLILFSVLVVFGVGIDMLGQMVDPGRYMTFVFEVVEDGGEMFIASVMLWYVTVVNKLNKGGFFAYFQDFLQSLYTARA